MAQPPTRTIDGFNFNLAGGRISNVTKGIVLNPAEPVFNMTDETKTIEIKIPYADNRTEATFTGTTRGPVVIKPDEIPYVNGPPTTFEMRPPFVPSLAWGEPTRAPIPQVIPHKVKLLPWTKVTVKLSATAATGNVPFTYTRYDGDVASESSSTETYIMEDGFYTITNYFDFQFEDCVSEPIPKKL